MPYANRQSVYRSLLVLILSALALERSLDFKRVEAERESVLRRLSERLSPASAETLAERSVAYRLGRINHAGFYRLLQTTLAAHGVTWHRVVVR